MKYNKWIGITTLALIMGSSSALASSITQSTKLKSWWNSVTINNATSERLGGVSSGDNLYILVRVPNFNDASPQINGTYGSFSTSCKRAKGQPSQGTLFKCPVQRKGTWSNKLTMGISTNNIGSDGHAYDATVTVANKPPQVTSTITLNLPKKPSDMQGQPSAITIDRAGTQVAKVTDAHWNKPTNVSVETFGEDQMTPFSVHVANKGRNRGFAKPAKLSMKSGQQKQVNIGYKDLYPAKGSAQVVLNTSGQQPNTKPSYQLISHDGSVEKEGKLNWGQSGETISGIPTRQDSKGLEYTLKTPGFIEDGTDYKPDNKQHDVVIQQGKTKHIKVHYKAKAIPTENVTINVSGLPKDDQKVKITLSDRQGDTKVVEVGNDKEGHVKIKRNKETWHVTAGSINDYHATINPKQFKANSDKQSVNIQYTKQAFIYAPYKDTSIHYNTNNNVISTRISSQGGNSLQPFAQSFPDRNKTVVLGFMTGQCGNETWAKWGSNIRGQVMADANVDKLVDHNIDYILSTGGANDGVLDCRVDNRNGQLDVNKAKEALEKTVKRYSSKDLIGLDYDIENVISLRRAPALLKATAALQKQRQQEGKKPLQISLTLASGGGSSSINYTGQQALKEARQAGLENFVVNLMTMNFGANCIKQSNSNRCDMGQSTIQAAKLLHKNYDMPYDRIALTPMIGRNNTQGEYTTINDMKEVAKFVKRNDLAGLHFWSYDRDKACQRGELSPVCNGMGTGSDKPEKLGYNKAMLKTFFGLKSK